MKFETQIILKRLAKTVFVSAFLSYAFAILLVIAAPLYLGKDLAITYVDTFTLVLIPLVFGLVYWHFVRRDFKRKSIGL